MKMKDKLENFDRDSTLKAWNDSFPLGSLKSELYNHWKKYVPIIYDPEFDYNNPTQLINNELHAKNILFKPMEYFLCGGEPDEVFASIKSTDITPNICGRVFKTGQPTYTCTDCAMDGTCVLCSECFQQSEHRSHRYKIFTSSGGGICDCGDVEAWKSNAYCKIHQPTNVDYISKDDHSTDLTNQINESNKALDILPTDIVDRAGSLLLSTIQYSVLMLTWQDPTKVPELLKSKSPNNNFVTMLFNDEVHTYEQVINTLCRAIECTHKEAVDFASIVDREGRSPVLIGSSPECERVKGTIERATSRHGSKSLKVVVFQSSIVAHQTFAFKLLVWINYVIKHSDGLRVLLCNLATQPFLDDEHCILEHIILHDTQIWKLARIKCHELFMSNMLMYPETKKKLAILFTQHYPTIAYDYIGSEHWYDDSVSDISVQIFTTPSVARYLIINKNVLTVVVDTFIHICQQFINASGKLSFDRTQHNNTFRRAQYILNDLHYLLIAPPKENEWCEGLRENFLNGFSSIMELLSSIQNMDAVVRKTGQHLDFEPEWETAYNLMYKLVPCLTSLEEWAATDQQVLLTCFDRCLQTVHTLNRKFVYGQASLLDGTVTVDRDTSTTTDQAGIRAPVLQNGIGTSTTKVIVYDLASQRVSVHLPVTRLLAGLYLHLAKYNFSFFYPDIEPCLRPTPPYMPTMLVTMMLAELLSKQIQLPNETVKELPEPQFHKDTAPIMEYLAPTIISVTRKEDLSPEMADVVEKTGMNKKYVDYPTVVEVLEYPLRTLVLTGQVQAGMWKRNGYSLLNQVYLYHNAKWRGHMYDRDILCLQITGSLIVGQGYPDRSADNYLVHLLNRYDLLRAVVTEGRGSGQLEAERSKPLNEGDEETESSKLKGALFEEFLDVLVVLISERYVCGVGHVTKEDIMEREILHQLCMGPVAHSELVKSLPEDIGKSPDFEKILSKIAVLRKSTDVAAKTKYELKPEFFRYYSPFFYHYTKTEQSKAEEFKKTRKSDTLEEGASPPPYPPDFTTTFEPLTKVLRCGLFLKIIRTGLKCAFQSNDSPNTLISSTDLQVHQVLFLICLALYEDKRQVTKGDVSDMLFIERIKQEGDLIKILNALPHDNRFEIYSDLAKYVLMLVDQVTTLRAQTTQENHKSGSSFIFESILTSTDPAMSGIAMEIEDVSEPPNLPPPTSQTFELPYRELRSKISGNQMTADLNRPSDYPPSSTSSSSPGDLHRRKRAEAASARRNKILAQMSQAQNSFIAEHRDLWDSIPSNSSSSSINLPPPSASAHGVATSAVSRPQDSAPATFGGVVLRGRTDDSTSFGNRDLIPNNSMMLDETKDARRSQIGMSDVVAGPNSNVDLSFTVITDVRAVEPLASRSNFSVSGPNRMPVREVVKRCKSSDVDTDGQQNFTCILCQEEQQISITGDALVMAAFVQNSTTLCRNSARKISPEDYAYDPLYPGSDLALGPVTSSCGHVMHRDCWQRFYDAVVARERRHALRFRFHHVSFDVERNEFLCPLCQALSNTVLPLLPPLTTLVVEGVGCHDDVGGDGHEEITFSQWLRVMKTIVRMSSLTPQPAEEDTPNYKTEWQYLLKTRDLDYILKFFDDEILPYTKFQALLQPSPSHKDLDISPSILSMLRTFSLTIYTVGLELDPFEDNDRLPVMTWHACAFTFCAVDAILGFGGKPLFGSLTARTRDCLSYLTRFTSVFGTCVKRELVRHHAIRLLKLAFGMIPEAEDKTTSCLLLDIDPFSYLVRLCFSCPFIFAEKDTPNTAVIAYGGPMNHFLLKLAYFVQIAQILVVYQTDPKPPPVPDSASNMEVDDTCTDSTFIYELWHEMKRVLHTSSVSEQKSSSTFDNQGTQEHGSSVETFDTGNGAELLVRLKVSLLPFLRCSSLFYHFLTDIPYPEGVLSSEPIGNTGLSYFEPLCQYLGLPTSFQTLFRSGDGRIHQLIMGNWLQHPKMKRALDPSNKEFIIRYPIVPRKLIQLPRDYTELISSAAKFTCPNTDGDESRAPTLCLVCGALLCSQSYCCQSELEVGGLGGGGTTPVGACTAHAFSCGAGTGIFLRIRECQILFLTGRTKGTFYPPPYIDAYGETDQGLRRGNPLFLCDERYESLHKIWLSNSIPDEISRSLETNPNLLSIDWQHL